MTDSSHDTVTVKLHVHSKPDLHYRRLVVIPRVITLTYLPEDPGPVGGIHPARAEVEGHLRSRLEIAGIVRPLIEVEESRPTRGRNWRSVWLYRNWPEYWPSWLIELGAEHRPHV
ncbi:hypothetical protein ACH4CC_14800 [Streptomyces lydicus]|uniref:hypothetical protein n=1 Tax=Streptomyces lydicus TaxID=47763 RepID=UPI0037AC4365